jgi:hypothetical protein
MIYGVSTFAPIPVFVGGLNDAGHIAMWANLAGSGVVGNDSYGYWTGGASTLALVVRKGDPAAGAPSGNFGVLGGPVAFNIEGRVAFGANLTGSGVNSTNDEGLWMGDSGSLALVARNGNEAAGTPGGVNYFRFAGASYPVLNDDGQIAFGSYLTGNGVDSTNELGIWSDGAGALALVARTGSHAPGTTDGVNFFDLHFPSLNSAGQTAFRANLTGGGVDFTNDKGIWATDQSGALQLIARTGDRLEVTPGELRTVSDLDFVTATGNGDNRPSAFNNFGQLVFWASFTDGSQGVFVSNAVAHVPGDFNNDGTVDAADYVVWRKNSGTQDGYDAWRANFGAALDRGIGSGATGSASAFAAPTSNSIPEPTCIVLFTSIGIGLLTRQCCRRRFGY